MFVEFAVPAVVSVTGSDDGCSVVAEHLKGMGSRLTVEESLATKWFRQSENSKINIWTKKINNVMYSNMIKFAISSVRRLITFQGLLENYNVTSDTRPSACDVTVETISHYGFKNQELSPINLLSS